jgi:ketosteroid isomerase-like protein
MRKITILSICIFIYATNVFSQTEQEKLTAIILHLDSAFWNAYNNCDTSAYKKFFTDDVEFYHDKGALQQGQLCL